MSDEGSRRGKLVPPFWVFVGSFATEATTPINDVKTEGLISERAVYGHWESVVNMRYFLVANKRTPFAIKPARISNASSNVGSALISPVSSTPSLGSDCCPPGCATVTCSLRMSLSSTVVGVVGVVEVFVVVGEMGAADDAASLNFSLFLLLLDFCLPEGSSSDIVLLSRASEGPPEGGAAALRLIGCCRDINGTGVGGIAE